MSTINIYSSSKYYISIDYADKIRISTSEKEPADILHDILKGKTGKYVRGLNKQALEQTGSADRATSFILFVTDFKSNSDCLRFMNDVKGSTQAYNDRKKELENKFVIIPGAGLHNVTPDALQAAFPESDMDVYTDRVEPPGNTVNTIDTTNSINNMDISNITNINNNNNNNNGSNRINLWNLLHQFYRENGVISSVKNTISTLCSSAWKDYGLQLQWYQPKFRPAGLEEMFRLADARLDECQYSIFSNNLHLVSSIPYYRGRETDSRFLDIPFEFSIPHNIVPNMNAWMNQNTYLGNNEQAYDDFTY